MSREFRPWWLATILAGLLLSTAAGVVVWGGVWKSGSAATQAAAVSTVLPAARTQVHSLGRLEPASRVLELYPESGNDGVTVRELHVSEGQDVAAGQLLVTLDNIERRRARLSEAEARLRAAEVHLQQVQAGSKAGDLAAQRAAVELADRQSQLSRREAERAVQLHARKAISDEQLESQQWQLDRWLLEKQRAEGLLSSLSEVRETDVRAAQSDIDAAVAAVASAQAELAGSELKAPLAGRILQIGRAHV